MDLDKGINVLSLFDGMSCGQIALERAGIKVNNYYASEIKTHAIKLTKYNYPKTIHIGDVTKVAYYDGVLHYENGSSIVNIDLLIGGSPCQDFSFLKSSYTTSGNYGLLGEQSKLFFEYDRLRVQLLNELPTLRFLLENVKMKKSSESMLNEYLNVSGEHINSKLVSAQNRQRIYWANFPILSIQDRHIDLQDILDRGGNLARYKVNKTPSRDIMWYDGKCKNITNSLKSSCLTTKMDRWNNAGLIAFEDYCRFLTPLECERLQTVPEGYTEYLTDSQRYDVLGDGWTVDIITEIFKGLDHDSV